jgi:hypothetical protein
MVDQVKAFPTVTGQTGMDLRDYFAANALQGYLAAHAGEDTPIPLAVNAAKSCYIFADAMMKAREEK